MTSGRTSREDAGFIVVEALVAMVLLVFTLGLVAALLHLGQRVADRGRGRDDLSHLATGSDALSGWLASAAAVRPVRPTGRGPVLFEGRADRLSFLTESTGDAQPPGMLAVTVGFATSGTFDRAGALLFDAAPLGLGDTTLPDLPARLPLQTHVVSAQFSYFGSPGDGMPAEWRQDWTGAARLPRLVALRVQVETGQRVENLAWTYRIMSQ